MRCNISKWLVIVSVISMALSACGGGGGSSPQSNVVLLKTSTLRNIQPGDTWNFTVSGTSSDGVNTVNINGTTTTQVLSSTKQSPITLTNCLDEYSITNLTTSSGQSITSNTLLTH